MNASIPCQNSFSESCACSNQGTVADLAGIALAQRVDLIRAQLGNTVSVCFKIVDQKNVLDAEVGCELSTVQSPRKIRQPQPPIAHRSRHAETCGSHLIRGQKFF